MDDVPAPYARYWRSEFFYALSLEAIYQTVRGWHRDWSRHRFYHWIALAASVGHRRDLRGADHA